MLGPEVGASVILEGTVRRAETGSGSHAAQPT